MEDRAFHLLLLTIVCILLLISSHSLRNYQQKQQSSAAGSKVERTVGENAQLAAFVLSMFNQTGEPPKGDRYASLPRKPLLSSFRHTPRLAIDELNKEVAEEERKAGVIKAELDMLRTVLLPEMDNKSIERKKRAAVERMSNNVIKREQMPLCPDISPDLLGPLMVDQSLTTMEKVEKELGWVGNGGKWAPSNCRQAQTVAFILPFRAREDHLLVWLRHIHPILARQQLDYQVFLVEQADQWPFNRAALMNVGVTETEKLGNFSCFVFHDVDMLPEDDRAVYKCPENEALHLAVAVSRWKYRLAYERYCGGVAALSSKLVKKINGMANSFYGWGGEDDDFYNRLKHNRIGVKRYPGNISRMTMLLHNSSSENPDLQDLMVRSEGKELLREGLSTLRYTLQSVEELPLYTRILVHLPKPPATPKLTWLESLQKGYSRVSGKALNRIAEVLVDISKSSANPSEEKVKIY